MDDLEQMIQAKGLTAPRVTPASIEAVIAAEYSFTADKAIGDAPVLDELKLLTIHILVLKNGFTVVGTSACASPENFDADVGRKAARNHALAQIWPLEGYLLKQTLHEVGLV